MKSLFSIAFFLFLGSNATFAQTKIDSTAKPDETTFYDGPVNALFAPGFLLKTRSNHYYEITGKLKQMNKIANPAVQVYKDKRKYNLVVEGVVQPIPAIKIQDVVESKIDGDFRGWDGTTSFKLLNGEEWVQDEMKTLFSPTIYRPVVYIYTGSDGNHKMKVTGVDETLQVKKK